jgi:hypothetical protein
LVEKEGADEMIPVEDKPYFMMDESWYYFDEKECRYYLTDKAPEEAKKSYDDFYADEDDLK